MKEITLPIYNTEGKEVDTITLRDGIFGDTVRNPAIYQAIAAFRANQRKGLAATKTRGEVSGGGKKPWKQKGTGRARVGSIRSPLWRHGGVVFGPHPRDFSYTLPAKIRKVALQSALLAKTNESSFLVLDTLSLENYKTKQIMEVFSNLKVCPAAGKKSKASDVKTRKILLLVEAMDEKIKKSARNIGFLEVNQAKDTNAYEVLKARTLIITRGGLDALVKRIAL